MSLKDDILKAARADAIPAGTSGLWLVVKAHFDKNKFAFRDGRLVRVPAGDFSYLYCATCATMHREPPGEVVMHDTPDELNTHLEFMLRAHGHVLVTGLGLGCVARGLLANPAVRYVTVLEKSRDVMKLVYPYMPTKRIQILRTDALRWCRRNAHKFDCAWHDLWSDTENGEPHLAVMHSALLRDCALTGIKLQGAWAFPRYQKRLWNRHPKLTIL